MASTSTHTPSDFGAQGPRLLTVIIPAYNVGAYIGTCIRSVISQTNAAQLIQVVVVVDGAVDDTLDQARTAALNNEEFVQIIAQPNSGLSGARNAGLALAKTSYVTFLDGDDIWNVGFLEKVAPLLIEGSSDIVEYDAETIDECGAFLAPLKIAAASKSAIHAVPFHDLLKYFRCYSWARIYRTTLVRRHPFPLGRRFEDTATTPWYYWYGQQITSLGYSLVGYRQRSSSILKSPNWQDIEDLVASTADAASMYSQSNSRYWQLVAHRIFQQACRRITWLPLSKWKEGVESARTAIAGVPHPPGFARWLQLNATLFYVALLFIKRKVTRN